MSVCWIIRAIYSYYFRLGLQWLLFTYAVTVISAVIIAFYGVKREKGGRWGIFMVLLVFYAITVITSTVLSRGVSNEISVNLDLFWSWRKAHSGNVEGILVLVENIILLGPIGFLLPMINEKRFWAVPTILIGFLFSLGIELSQLFLKRGWFELDDIMNNTIGVIIGNVAAAIVLQVRKWIRAR